MSNSKIFVLSVILLAIGGLNWGLVGLFNFNLVSTLFGDMSILSRIVDSTIIVASHKLTKKDNLQKIKKSIENVGGKIAGVVLNKIPVNIQKYKSTYYYSSSKGTRSDRTKEIEYKIEKNEEINKEKSEEIMKQLDEFLNKKNDSI